MKSVGIVGNGYVGKSTLETLPSNKHCNVIIYDITPEMCVPIGCTIDDVSKCDLIFVCVPTPMNKNGSCHTGIVRSVLSSLKEAGATDVIVRSTVPIGFCRENGCLFMPEFITEANWMNDIKNTYEWIVGMDEVHPVNCWENTIHIPGGSIGEHSGRFSAGSHLVGCTSSDMIVINDLANLLTESVNEGRIAGAKIVQVRSDEAEMAKLSRNSFLASKVSFFNEISVLCKKYNIDYASTRSLIIMDDRIGNSHTMVPGPDGMNGFGGTCFVKDIWSLKTAFINNPTGVDIESPMIDSVIYRNECIDRIGRDWEKLKGRAVLEDKKQE